MKFHNVARQSHYCRPCWRGRQFCGDIFVSFLPLNDVQSRGIETRLLFPIIIKISMKLFKHLLDEKLLRDDVVCLAGHTKITIKIQSPKWLFVLLKNRCQRTIHQQNTLIKISVQSISLNSQLLLLFLQETTVQEQLTYFHLESPS